MDCLVDTNVISDLTTQDPKWFDWSLEELSRTGRRFIVNPLIYSELCCRTESYAETDALLKELGLDYCELPREALFLAAQAFVRYKQMGGRKSSPLPDFFIGAHAAVLGIPIITRDIGRYQSYFPSVPLICP